MVAYTNHFIQALQDRNPADRLLTEGNRFVTADELLQSSCRLAVSLSKCGVQAGDRVVLAIKPGVEFLQVIYANMMLRTVVSIIDPEMGRENYRSKLRQFSPRHAFVDSRLIFLNEHPLIKGLLMRFNKSIPIFPRPKGCSLFTTGPWLPLVQRHKHVGSLAKNSQPIIWKEGNEEEDFLVTYTSGTLDEPKGVVHSYRSLFNSIHYLTAMLHENQDEIIATHLPHFALLGINAGLKVFLWDYKMTAADKLNFVNTHQVTTLFGPPSDFLGAIDRLLISKTTLPACLRNIYLGSAPIYTSFLSRLIPLSDNVKVTCLYGMTENLMVTRQDGREKLAYMDQGDLVGTPFPNVRITTAEDGEIGIQSDQLFSKYWQQQDAAAVHWTGDLGKVDQQGRLILLGRKKDMMIRGNFNVYPGLYEPTISKIKGIREAVMVGIYNAQKADEEIFLVVDAVEGLSAAVIMSQLMRGEYSIDKEAWPDEIIFMKIPHSGRQNKVNRRSLVELIKESKG